MDVLVASCTKLPSVEPANLSASVIGWLASFPAGNGAAANRVRVAKATHPLQSTLALVCNGNMCRHCWDGRCTRILSGRPGLAIELVDSLQVGQEVWCKFWANEVFAGSDKSTT